MTEWTLAATVESIPVVTAAVDDLLEALDCPMKAQMQIDIAIDELLGNIAHYAYTPGTGEVTVRFDFDEGSRAVDITFIDGGIPYNPLEREDPDVTLAPDARKVGGLGIFLVKRTMDGMRYERRDGKNVLTIRKNI